MRVLGYWTILVALSISVVAAYYSIIGLVAIFAAAAIPVILMGSVLEVAKITTAVWLHVNWKNAGFLIKTYLTSATVLLMFITSMGIFGFLSKAHIEQTAVALEGQAQLERIESDISRQNDIVARAESRIQQLESADSNSDASTQEKISAEEQRIATVYERLRADIDLVNSSVNTDIEPYVAQQQQADLVLQQIAEYVAANEIRALQGLIGARQDGRYGPNTASAVQAFREKNEADRAEALARIDARREQAREEIARLRQIAENTVAQANALIDRLRQQLGATTNENRTADIQEQRSIIETANDNIDALFEQKYAIEIEARKLEAEVGPVKYIAELVYGEGTGRDTLEQAVRWVILILVAVFDPLAVVLVISGISILEQNPKQRKEKSNNDINKLLHMETPIGTTETEEDRDSHEIELKEEIDNKIEQPDIEFQGVVYKPTHHDYQRIKEQIKLNKIYREKVEKEQLVNKIVSEITIDDKVESPAIIKKKIEEMLDKDAIELIKNADDKTILEVYNAIVKDKKI